MNPLAERIKDIRSAPGGCIECGFTMFEEGIKEGARLALKDAIRIMREHISASYPHNCLAIEQEIKALMAELESKEKA